MTSAPTFGWDLVYAVRLDEVNARIAEQERTPRRFTRTVDEVTVSGTLGDWHIVPGGSGHVLLIELALTDGLVEGGTVPPTRIAGRVTLAIELMALHEVDGKRAALRVRQPDTGEDEDEAPGNSSLFAIRQIALTGTRSTAVRLLVRLALQEWLQDNQGVIEHIFAVIDVEQATRGHPFAWLRPTELSYAFGDGVTPERCVLAVLAMVGGRSSSDLDQQVSITAIPPGCTAAILISPHLLLDGIFRDALPQAFAGLAAEDFVLDSQSPRLALAARRPLTPLKQGSDDHPHALRELSVTFRGSEIVSEIVHEVEVDWSLKIITSTRSVHAVKAVTDAQGRSTFTFVRIGEPQMHHTSEIDPDAARRDEIVSKAILVIGTVASLVTAGATSLLILVGTTLLCGLMDHRISLLQATAGHAPGLDLLAFNAASPCVWSGDRLFRVAGVDLAESLRLHGHLHPKETPG